MTEVSSGATPHAPADAGRRTFVALGCASAAMLAFAMAGRPGAPFGVARAFAAEPFSDAGYDAFISLSQRLTGRSSFDKVLGQRVYTALARESTAFSERVDALNIWLQSHGGVPSDVVTDALKGEQPELASAIGDIMRAWYLGVVGTAPHVQVVAYERALMFDPVSDVLTTPSYCRDVPFYWVHKPAG